MDRLTEDLIDIRSVLETKNNIIKQLKIELDGCHSSIVQLQIQNEEMFMMLTVYENGFLEAQSRLDTEIAEMDLLNKETEKKISFLMDQLEVKNDALAKAQRVIQQEREKAELLLKKLESLNLTEKQQHCSMSTEFERQDEKLEQKVSEALKRVDLELTEKTWETHKIEFELEMWIWFAERLNSSIEKSQDVRRQLEESLLAQVEVEESLKQEKYELLNMVEERDMIIENLKQEIMPLGVPLARIDTLTIVNPPERWDKIKTTEDHEELESSFEHDKEKITQLVHIKNKKINELVKHLESLEQKFNSSSTCFSSQLEEKEAYIDLICVAWEKIAAAEILVKLEIEEKKLIIQELEDNTRDVQQKLESQEISLSQSGKQAFQIEAELEAKQLEMKKLIRKMKEKVKDSDAIINELKSEKKVLSEDIIKLSSERENSLDCTGGLCERIHEFSGEDVQLMGMKQHSAEFR